MQDAFRHFGVILIENFVKRCNWTAVYKVRKELKRSKSREVSRAGHWPVARASGCS